MAGTEDVRRCLALVMVVRTGAYLLPRMSQCHLGVVHVETAHDGAVVVSDRRAEGAGGRRRTGTGSGAAARTADEGLPFGTAGSAELEEVGGRGTGARAGAAVDVDAARGTAAAGLPTIGSGRGTGSASGGIGHLNIFGRRRRRGGEAVSRSAAARLVAEAAAHGIEEVGYDHHGWLYLLSFDSLLPSMIQGSRTNNMNDGRGWRQFRATDSKILERTNENLRRRRCRRAEIIRGVL